MLLKDSTHLAAIILFVMSIIIFVSYKKPLFILIYTLFTIFIIEILPEILLIEINLDIFIYRGLYLIMIILLFISLFKSNKTNIDNSEYREFNMSGSLFPLILLIIPIVILVNSYISEANALKNSNLVIVYNMDSGYKCYAVNEENIKEVSMGIEYGGEELKKILPRYSEYTFGFYDEIKTEYDRVSIYSNGNLLYSTKTIDKVPYGTVERVYYK